MNAETNWARANRLLAPVVVVAFLVLTWVWYMPLNEEHEKLKQRDMRLADEVAREEALARQQEAYIEDLRKNPRLAEQLAREKLGLARSNETVIRWEAPATNTPSTRP